MKRDAKNLSEMPDDTGASNSQDLWLKIIRRLRVGGVRRVV